MFLYKNLFFPISSILSIPIMLMGINGGSFPAICRVYFFQFFCSISLSLKFLKVDEGFLRDKIICYYHFMSYVLVLQTRKLILFFAIFFQVFFWKFVVFLVFPASGTRKSPLRLDNTALHSF